MDDYVNIDHQNHLFVLQGVCILQLLKTKNNWSPLNWYVFFSICFHCCSVVLFAMKQFARVLARSFVTIDDFEYQLWNNIFHLAVAFVTQESLQLEQFSPGKRNSILETWVFLILYRNTQMLIFGFPGVLLSLQSYVSNHAKTLLQNVHFSASFATDFSIFWDTHITIFKRLCVIKLIPTCSLESATLFKQTFHQLVA